MENRFMENMPICGAEKKSFYGFSGIFIIHSNKPKQRTRIACAVKDEGGTH